MKLKRKILLYMLLVILLPFSLKADMFAGYDSFCGLPVIVGHEPQIATARTNAYGKKFIRIDPSAMSNWSMSRLFTLAHECAHHLLGHTNSLGKAERFYGGTAKQELEADCWAARKLQSIGYHNDITRTILQHAHTGHFSTGGYPSGKQRANNILSCLGKGNQTCRNVQVDELYIDYQTGIQNRQVPCSHCGFDFNGIWGCMHQYDIVPVQVQIPVDRIRTVTKRVCD